MKRVDLIRHLERYGCEFLREGNSHSVYQSWCPEILNGSASPRGE
jgi:hypothetical protein